VQPYLVDVREATRLLGIGKTSLYKLLKNRALESRSMGRKTLITMASIRALVDGAQPPEMEG
jgi:excisionase family DNA binding protein